MGACVEEEDVGISLNEPSAIESLDALCAHGVKRGSEVFVRWLDLLDLHGGGLVGEWADKTISIAKLRDGDGDFCFDDCVDPADLVGNLPSALEEEGVGDITGGGRRMGVLLGRGRHGEKSEKRRSKSMNLEVTTMTSSSLVTPR